MTFKQRLALAVNYIPKSNSESFPYGEDTYVREMVAITIAADKSVQRP